MKSFFKNNKSLLQLSGANMLVLVFPTLLIPVFSRIYSVADFAQLGLFTTLLSLFVPYLSLHFQQAIPVPTDKREINGLTQISLWLVALSTTVLCLAWFFIPAFSKALDPEDYLGNLAYVLPVALLIGGYLQVVQHWILQGGAFSRYAASKSILAITQSSVRYLLGVTKVVQGGLVLSYLIGQFAQILGFGRKMKTGELQSLSELKSTFKKYLSFLKFGFPSSVIISISNFVPLIILTHFFSEEIVGQYSMALRLGSIPMFLLATAFGQVYFADCKKNPEQVGSITLHFLQRSIKLSSPVLAVGVFLILPVGSVVIGKEWKLSLEMLLLLLPLLWTNFIFLPLTKLFEIKNRQDLGFYFSLFAIVTRLTPFLFALYFGFEIEKVLLILVFGGLLSNIIGFEITRKMVDFSGVSLLKITWMYFLPTIFVLIAYFMFHN